MPGFANTSTLAAIMETSHYPMILSVLLVVLSLTSLAQGTKSEQIRLIKKEFQIINNETTLKKIKLENEEFLTNMTDGGGQLVGYFDTAHIRKIYQWIGLSNGNEITEYYFKNGKLIFVYAIFKSFIFDQKYQQFNRTKTKTTSEGRFYFNNKKLIESLISGQNRFGNRSRDPEKEFLNEAMDNLKLLSKRN